MSEQTNGTEALNLATQHHAAGRLPEAEAIYQQILQIDPEQPVALHLLGVIAHQVGKNDIAVDLISRAIAIRPDYAEAHYNLGKTFKELARLEDAITSFNKALASKPDYAEAHNNLGDLFREQGKLDDAITSFQNALAIRPNDAKAYSNVGSACQELGKLDLAVDNYHKALTINPDFAEVHCNLGSALKELGRFEEAIASHRTALILKPDYEVAYYNLGNVFDGLEQPEQALAHYRKAHAINPDYGDAHYGISTVLLECGDLKKGWAEYEWRRSKETKPPHPRYFPQARWNGEPLHGKSILLWGEQGIGDEIRFASIIPDIVSIAGQCAIECEPRLVDLFARSFPEAQVHARPYVEAESGAEAFDYQIPTPSLALHLRSSIEDFPDSPSYLVADKQRRQLWRARIAALGGGLKVGISWRSQMIDTHRSLTFASIADLEPLLGLKNVVFINLQYGQCTDEVAEFKKLYGVPLHTWDDIDLKEDIDDAMALTACLDVVVTLISAVCEMSGALGIATYAFHPPSCCSTMLGTDNLPFHPSVRLYKRRVDEGWQRVLSEITEDMGK